MYKVEMDVVADPHGDVELLIEDTLKTHPNLMLKDTGARPNGNYEVAIYGSLRDIHRLVTEWVGDDSEQALWYMTLAVEITDPHTLLGLTK